MDEARIVAGVAVGVFMAGLAWIAAWFLQGRRGPRSAAGAVLGWGGLMVLWALGGWVLVQRFTGGLADVTNLTDEFPWGLWVSFDVLCGVALAAGGFLTAGASHIFGVGKLHGVVRPAVLTAFLGYLLVVGGLVFDLGRPYSIWHPIIHWQHRSVMFEVAWCVTLYNTVLALEFLPILLEKLGWKTALRMVKRITIPVVIAGVVLSTLHQSSLGAVFLIVPHKLLPLWYSPLLPLYFLMTAVAVGFAMVVFESNLSRIFLGHEGDPKVHRLALRVFGPVAAVFLVLRMVDITARGAWPSAFRHPVPGIAFLVETALLAVPLLVLLVKRWAASPRALFVASGATVFGVMLNRLNVGWFGLLSSSGGVYVPAWQEVVVSLVLLSLGVVAFGLAARYLPLFEHEEEEHSEGKPAAIAPAPATA